MVKKFNEFNKYDIFLSMPTTDGYEFLSNKYDLPFKINEYINNNKLYQVNVLCDNDLVAICIFKLDNNRIHINYTYIINILQGKGVNNLILNKLYEFSISKSVNLITVNLRESNIFSKKSFLKNGFIINDKVELFYPDGEKKIPLFKKI